MIIKAMMYGMSVSSRPRPDPITKSKRVFIYVTTASQLNPMLEVKVVEAVEIIESMFTFFCFDK